jgi:hypothetical protein
MGEKDTWSSQAPNGEGGGCRYWSDILTHKDGEALLYENYADTFSDNGVTDRRKRAVHRALMALGGQT